MRTRRLAALSPPARRRSPLAGARPAPPRAKDAAETSSTQDTNPVVVDRHDARFRARHAITRHDAEQ
jgi:hypothetical protein